VKWRPVLLCPLLAGLLAMSLAGIAVPRAEAAAACDKAGSNDFDGDGRPDVVVGDPLADAAGLRGAGAVHILPADGSRGGLVLTAPDPHAGDAFGWTVRTVHFDGDACLDVVVGAPYTADDGKAGAGAVYVVRGGAYGGRIPPEAITEISPPRPEKNAHFGWSLAAARSPGHPAGVIAVGAPYENADGTTDAGAIYMYSAKPAGGMEAPIHVTQQTDGIVGNSEEGDMFGWALVFGRLGGRAGSMDLAIGSPYENDDGVGRQRENTGKADTGAVEVIFDAAERGKPLTSVNWGIPQSIKSVTEHPGDRYGYAIAYAESGGKPYVAASAPLADVDGVKDAGLVEVFQPDKSGKLVPVRTIRLGGEGLTDQPARAGAALGWSLAMVGTPTSLDLAIGSPFDSHGATEAGVIRTVPLTGDQGGRLILPQEPHAYDHFGWSVASYGAAGSFDTGTGLLAGVPDERSAPGGAVAVLREGGRARLLVPGRDGVPAVPGGTPADFGTALSG
jgi:hypothetical protein